MTSKKDILPPMRCRYILCVPFLIFAAISCGGSGSTENRAGTTIAEVDDDTAPESSAGQSTTEAPEVEIQDAEDPVIQDTHEPRRTLQFEYTDADQWHYSGAIDIPVLRFEFETDISTSPPGRARLAITQYGDDVGRDERTFNADNPGRASTSFVRVVIADAWYVEVDQALAGEWTGGRSYTGDQGCIFDDTGTEGPPLPASLLCHFPVRQGGVPGGDGETRYTNERDEVLVERMVAALDGSSPGHMIRFDLPDAGYCYVGIQSTGEIVVAPECGALSVK